MVFGAPDLFAIEAEVSEVHGKWTYGRLRFWVGGRGIGDWDETSDLATSARWGRTFLRASPRRARADLDRASTSEVYELLYGRFVEPVNAPKLKPWAGPWERDQYILDDVGESALRDKYAVLVISKGDGSDRIVVHCFDEDRPWEVLVPPGMCNDVIDAYCTWAEAQRA